MIGQVLNIIPTTDERNATRTADAAAAVALEATNFALTPPTATAIITNTATQTLMATITPSATITETPAPTDTATPVTPNATITETAVSTAVVFNEAEYIGMLQDGLFIAAGGRDIISVRVADGRANNGERVIIIAYASTETVTDDIVDEVIDLFSAIGATIDANDMDVDSIALIAGDAFGNTAGILTVSVSDLMAFHNGEVNRFELIERANFEDLTVSQSSTSGAVAPSGNSSILTVNPQTYYIASGGARLRSQPNTSGVELTFLNGATAIIVTGMVDGQAVESGNLVWYVTSSPPAK